MRRLLLLPYTSCFISLTALFPISATADSNASAKTPIEEVEVIGVKQRLEQAGALLDTIQKTEVIGADSIEAKHAANLSEAIAESPGVRVANECSICGVKRIMLNGLKGEHTTILTDGLPVHTLISGYYAVDAVATTGVERIEVARGAGASLTTPEAMGGTVNIVTKEEFENSGAVDVSAGENGFRQIGLLATAISDDQKSRVTLIGQFDTRDQFDGDNNGVSENPFQENRSFTVRLSHDLSYRDNIVVRYSNVYSELFGGPVLGKNVGSIGQALASFANGPSQQLFVNNDVNEQFIGQPYETAEWVETRREEFSVQWLRELNDSWNLRLSASYSEHEQDSFYEGFDYFGDDELQFYDARLNYLASATHQFTFGIDSKTDTLESSSIAGQASPDYVADSFDYQTQGLYFQDTWTPTDAIELAFAIRLDKVEADFTDPAQPGTEIDETIVSPRLDGRIFHNEKWTSRLSAGRGYRAPLSFFETDHGILDGDAGFAIDVDKLERSIAGSYALSYEGEKFVSTVSLAWTEVENLAGLSETDSGIPLLTQIDDKGAVTSADIALSYPLADNFTINFIIESYNYDDNFKESYTIAPIEERINFGFDYDFSGWDLVVNASWVGSRDLTDYGYQGTDVSGSGINKPTNAPSYWTMDFRIAKSLSSSLNFYAGANNLFDYNQAADESSPLFFGSEGSYDVTYIYGPLRGRELYAGLKWSF